MKKRKIILDCDPGHDDAVAILLASSYEEIDLCALTIESGNQTLEKTSRNALNLVQYLSLDVPVAKGEAKPMVRDAQICPEIHGESGLDGYEFPPLYKRCVKQDAVTLLKEMLTKDEYTIVATGPLTNIGVLLNKYPEVKNNITEIVLMGGSIGFGNVTPAAEFNIFCDPEAADIVFTSGIKVTMIGLDVTRKILITNKINEEIKNINNKASTLFYPLMKVFIENQKKVFGFDGAPLHDPATIVYLVKPEIFKAEFMNVTIDVSKGPSYGRTNCDQFDYLKLKKNAFVALDVDVDAYFEEIKNCIKKY